jgi:ABC-type sugar transport system ATPase subunit
MTSALEQRSSATASEPGATVLELSDIRKSFGGAEALRGVSLSMTGGEILAIVGENGAGKSTLIKIAAGFYPSHSFEGGIRMGGQTVSFRSVHDAEAMGVLHIPQEVQVVPELSIAENVYLGREPGTVVRRREMIDGTAKALARLGLYFDPAMPIKNLGVGQQQAVLLARALVQETKFVLFDEPTASLTGTEVAKLFGVMNRLKGDGVGCVFVSHRLDEVLGIADRIAIMRNGELVAVLPRAEADAGKLVTLEPPPVAPSTRLPAASAIPLSSVAVAMPTTFPPPSPSPVGENPS